MDRKEDRPRILGEAPPPLDVPGAAPAIADGVRSWDRYYLDAEDREFWYVVNRDDA